jgi:hypothetical protein
VDGQGAQLTGGSVVLAGMTRATNNVDPAQPVPPDTPTMMLRHAAVHVRSRDGQPVPYLAVTMDVLLDGRPITYEQAALPMVPEEADAAGELYYGNNVRFGPRGVYQVFVRVQRSPMLGKEPPPAALFNLVLK